MIHTIVSRLIYEGKRDMAKEFMLHNLEHVGTYTQTHTHTHTQRHTPVSYTHLTLPTKA